MSLLHRCLQLGTLFLTAVAIDSAATAAAEAKTASAKACQVVDAQKINGAYRLADGKLMSILPAGTDGQRRITYFDSGKSHRLIPEGELRFRSSSDWDSATPTEHRYQFRVARDGFVQSLTIESSHRPRQVATKIALREWPVTFKSGGAELFGKLTLPASGKGKAPYKTVIFVHGSDQTASVDREWLTHLLAANSIATFVFDKRGSGCSGGQYVQHFDVLSNDVTAAAEWLRTRPEIDQGAIGLAGFSQGGWIAPLAALKDPTIKFVAVGYGLTVSMAEEDRLETPLKLKAAGLDDQSIAEFEELNGLLHRVAREKFKDWQPFDEGLEKFKDRAWLNSVKRTGGWLAVTLQMGVAQAKQVAPQMFEHFMQPFYEPVPTLEKLALPMLWLIAAQDMEAPPEETITTLARLQRQGKPVSMVVFPKADHGLKEFAVKDGRRQTTKYAENYFSTLLQWIERQ
jgi:uncharacterized protein